MASDWRTTLASADLEFIRTEYDDRGSSGALRQILRSRAAHVVALSVLAVAQPLFDVLGKNPELFVARGAEAAEILIFCLVAFLGVPAFLIAAAELAGRAASAKSSGGEGSREKARERAYLGVFALLVALFLLLAYKQASGMPGAWNFLPAVLLGFGFGLLYRRYRAVRDVLSILALLALVPPFFFLGSAPIRDLLRPAAVGEGVAALQVEREVPVVLVVFDELPTSSLLNAERLVDPVLFPHFAALQGTSTWYRNATTVATLTLTALPAILSGRYPRDHLQATLRDHPRNLFSLLPESYDFAVLEPRTELCPASRCGRPRRPFGERLATLLEDLSLVYLHLVLPENLAEKLPNITTTWDFGRIPDKAGAFREFLGRLQPGRGPSLIFAHAELPHHPWIYLPSGRRYHPGGELYVDGLAVELGDVSPQWVEDDWAVIQAYQRHLLQLRFTDRLLGELLGRLNEIGLYEKALVIVTADHGISFAPGEPFRTVNERNYADIMSVPLFVKLPGQTVGAIDDREAELIDILPTVAGVLGLPLEDTLDGRSLLGDAVPRQEKFVFHSETKKLRIADPLMWDKYETVRRKLTFFGSRPAPETLFRIGPGRARLLGRSLGELEIRPSPGRLRAEIADVHRLARTRPEEEVLPNRVAGRVLDLGASAEARVQLALALNGVVRALTFTRVEPKTAGRFSFLLPEDALQPGRSSIELLRILREERSFVLEPVALEPPVVYTLEGEGDQARIVSSDGPSFPVRPELFRGEVFDILYKNREFRVEFLGWAEERSSGAPADTIVVFAEGAFVHAGRTNLAEHPGRHRYRLEGHEKSGFVYFLPRESTAGSLRFFALSSSGEAAELRYLRDMSPREHVSF